MKNPAGIAFLDHTADVGIAVRARSLESLFDGAARGMLDLLRGNDDQEPRPAAPSEAESGSGSGSELAGAPVGIGLEATGPAVLLADWLRELLFLHEVEHRDYIEAVFDRLERTVLSAKVRTEPSRRAVREIKGVTYHELEVAETDDGWRARVIFDV